MNSLCKTLIEGGPSEEEITLLCVLSIMDETMRVLAETPAYGKAVMHTYNEIEEYLDKEGFEQ